MLHGYRRGHGFKSHTGLNFFSGLIFTSAQVVRITSRITFFHLFNPVWQDVANMWLWSFTHVHAECNPRIKTSELWNKSHIHIACISLSFPSIGCFRLWCGSSTAWEQFWIPLRWCISHKEERGSSVPRVPHARNAWQSWWSFQENCATLWCCYNGIII